MELDAAVVERDAEVLDADPEVVEVEEAEEVDPAGSAGRSVSRLPEEEAVGVDGQARDACCADARVDCMIVRRRRRSAGNMTVAVLTVTSGNGVVALNDWSLFGS